MTMPVRPARHPAPAALARRAAGLPAAATAALTLAGSAAPLVAQAPVPWLTLRRCEAPRQPLGVLHGQGQVVYELGRDGRPDTASVRVVRSPDLSPPALRSAAVRLLSACRFESGGRASRADVRVLERIVFHDSTAELRSPQPAPDSVAAPPPDVAAPLALDGPVDENDPRLEERPRQLRCEYSTGPRPSTQETNRSRQEAEREIDELARRNTGRVEARAVVGADGRVERRSIVVVNATNPRTTDGLVRDLATCRYAPGRIAGTPVAVTMTLGMGVEVRVERIDP